MTAMFRSALRVAVMSPLTLSLAGCSIKMMAINSLGNAMASGSASSFARDEDAELVGDAVPFALKTMESLLEQSPRHRGLLTAATSGFTQYGYAFVQQEADFVEAQDLDRATRMRLRAKKLYLRAVEYGLRGLELEMPGFGEQLATAPDAALSNARKKHVPLLYWTGAAWAAAFALDVNDAELSIRQTSIEKMMRRALALDESWENGSLHEFFIAWEAAQASTGGSMAKAREHFARATKLSGGLRLSPYVALAESVSIVENNRKEFETILNQALAIDISKTPDQKLVNVINQRRARWLLGRIDDLFID